MTYMKTMLVAGLGLGAGQAAGSPVGLDWLAGHWCGGDADNRIEEVWLPEAGGALLGMSRTVRQGKPASFEFMRVLREDDHVALHVQPNGEPPTVFTEAASGEGWMRFENAAHDFPNRIEYRRDGNRLSAWIAGPGQDGKEMKIPFEYRACDK